MFAFEIIRDIIKEIGTAFSVQTASKMKISESAISTDQVERNRFSKKSASGNKTRRYNQKADNYDRDSNHITPSIKERRKN